MTDNTVVKIDTSKGEITIELFDEDAPETVENFLNYVKDDFYRGLIFHRVIDKFMIQGGGFKPGMIEKDVPHDPIQNEAKKSGHRNERGTIAMARTSEPHSATSQFFINLKDNSRLDWDRADDGFGYCVFGEVIDGMDVVDEIGGIDTREERGHSDVPAEDIKIKGTEIV